MTYLLAEPDRDPAERKITPRQAKILQLLAGGRTMKQIADTLTISPGTVAFHKCRMMEKLRTFTNADLFRYAMRHHMISG